MSFGVVPIDLLIHSYLLVREDKLDLTNHYFEVTGCSAYKGWLGAGIQWKFPVGCKEAHSQYM
jgi:hypothetical protein